MTASSAAAHTSVIRHWSPNPRIASGSSGLQFIPSSHDMYYTHSYLSGGGPPQAVGQFLSPCCVDRDLWVKSGSQPITNRLTPISVAMAIEVYFKWLPTTVPQSQKDISRGRDTGPPPLLRSSYECGWNLSKSHCCYLHIFQLIIYWMVT